MDAVFDDTLSDILEDEGESVTYDGEPIQAIVLYGQDQEGDSLFDVMDLIVSSSDVSDPTYRITAVVDSQTWYFWKKIDGNPVLKTMRFRKDERPVL